MSTDSGRHGMGTTRADEAADWFLRLKDDEVTERDLSQWLEWCADPENLREFQRTRATWDSFGRLGPAAAELLETLLAERRGAARPPAAILAGALQSPPVRLTPQSRQRLQSWLRGLAAALVMAAVISGAWYAYDSRIRGRQPPPSPLARQTIIRSSVLPDGSTLTLAPRTEIEVDFDATGRRLAMSQGDAYFDVQPDESKPFVVQAGVLRVTAVGTAFDVRARADRITVTVQEGVVEVARVNDGDGTFDSDAWRVGAGQQISYDVSKGAARIAAVDPERALAWREGRLEYFSEPLGSVVADVGRYSGRAIEIGDPDLGALTFTGTVFTGAVDDWLGAVESTFPVRVVVTRDDHVLLLHRSPDEVPNAGR